MRAVIYTNYGGPEVLQIKEIEKPFPEDDEVLVKVSAVSINDWDSGLRQGDIINRVLNGLLRPRRKILGSDILDELKQSAKMLPSLKQVIMCMVI